MSALHEYRLTGGGSITEVSVLQWVSAIYVCLPYRGCQHYMDLCLTVGASIIGVSFLQGVSALNECPYYRKCQHYMGVCITGNISNTLVSVLQRVSAVHGCLHYRGAHPCNAGRSLEGRHQSNTSVPCKTVTHVMLTPTVRQTPM